MKQQKVYTVGITELEDFSFSIFEGIPDITAAKQVPWRCAYMM